MSKKKNSETPFHMQEVDPEDTVIVPKEAGSNDADGSDMAEIELGSIQTSPNTNYAEYNVSGKGLISSAKVTPDGRIVISLSLKQKLPELPKDYAKDVKEFAIDKDQFDKPPAMSIVIMIVGSRGDVQPFLALGKSLIRDGHRVRIATHSSFEEFVRENGLEFFNIGGDPKDLMAYMVKNPGLIPGLESLTNGDIGRKRKMLEEMLDGCWRACFEPDSKTNDAFLADAIISNPPTFAHIHCAEALGIPLLMSFTMPWCPTTSFPHPLVNISQSNAERGLTNYLSYAMAEMLTWQGMGDIVNRFRAKTLGLEPLSMRSGPGVVDRLKVPWTYCLSPALVPKPADWRNHIDVVGFYFLELATNYKPAEDLAAFLEKGPPPIYIGFGSVVVEDPDAMTKTILEAVKRAGVRALISAGWGKIGGDIIPDDVFILGNVPHDWLFTKVSAVCHHGGAGTTAAGLRIGKPTIVVPFFGDQPFWGMMINRAGAGPKPIPHRELNADNLTAAIKFVTSQSAQEAAARMGEQIRGEDGVTEGVLSFYKHLPLLNMRCDLDPTRLAVWWSTEHCLKLSAFAAQVLQDAKKLTVNTLDAHRPKEYETRKKVSDPVTGGASAIFWTITHYYAGIAQIFYNPPKGIVNTTTAIPRGIMNIVADIHEGLHNAPKLYGSDVREHGNVDDFKSGLREAGKGFFYGYYDGITGLIREPMEGAKKEGWLGAIKGAGRSYVNVNMRPAAGAIGLVAHPVQGIWKSMQKAWAKKQEVQGREVRISNGVSAVKASSAAERNNILKAFEEAQKSLAERRKKYKADAKKAIEDNGLSSFTPYDSQGDSSTSRSEESSELQTPAEPETPPESIAEEGDDGDAQFERDMELAKQISLAEQRGYERGRREGPGIGE